MFRWIIILFIFVHSLYALSDEGILKRADSLMKHSNKNDQFSAYNDYKNLYLKAIISNDAKLKMHSLQGVIKSGQNLKLDVSLYSDELLKSQSDKAPTTDTNKKIKPRYKCRLKSVKTQDDTLVLKFNNEVYPDQIKYFTFYNPASKSYKYVFDISNSFLTRSKNLKKDGIDRIKLAQFNPNTLRLVIENSQKVDISSNQKDTEFIISFLLPSQSQNAKSILSKKCDTKKVIPQHKAPTRVDRDKIIVIDAGHGGKDPGATGYKHYREKVVVLDIAKNLRNILKTRGYKVYMTRDKDKFIELSNRTGYANKKNANIFISIHANAVEKKQALDVSGIECYFLSPSRSNRAEKVAAIENSADMSLMNIYGKQSFLNVLNHHKIIASNKLAIDLQRGILGTLNKSYKNVKDSGVREGPFWVLVGAQMPAVLVEVGFISHPDEAQRLTDKKYQKKFALGMANGIERYFINN